MVYSDRSKLPDGNAGAGFVVFQLGRQIGSDVFPLGKVCVVEDAEVHAALQEIKYAISLSSNRFSEYIWVFIDNYSVARKLLPKTPVLSSQTAYLEALETIKL